MYSTKVCGAIDTRPNIGSLIFDHRNIRRNLGSMLECERNWNSVVLLDLAGAGQSAIELIDTLLKEERLSTNKSAVQGLEEMKLLLRYCEFYGVLDKVFAIRYKVTFVKITTGVTVF